jgi:3-methyladenine DNA glycosylase AlkD
MTLQEVMTALEKLGSEQVRKIWTNHGVTGDFFGVKVGDMKVIQKQIKKNPQLASALYKTHNADAMYLAGLICDPAQMTKTELQYWAKHANYLVGEYTVAWAAAESPYGHELAMEWIHAAGEYPAAIGWSTYACLLALWPDDRLDREEIKHLMHLIQKTIHTQPGRVRYAMNNFLISTGTYLAALTEEAKKIAAQIGTVYVNMGNTACKVPNAVAYIEKAAAKGKRGKKKKTVFC